MSHVPTVLKSDRSVFDKMLPVNDNICCFPFLDGGVPRSEYCGVYISQLIHFAGASCHMLLTSTLAIIVDSGGFLGKANGVINFAVPFLNFVNSAVVWCLDSRLGLGLSCARDFRSLASTVTWCIG